MGYFNIKTSKICMGILCFLLTWEIPTSTHINRIEIAWLISVSLNFFHHVRACPPTSISLTVQMSILFKKGENKTLSSRLLLPISRLKKWVRNTSVLEWEFFYILSGKVLDYTFKHMFLPQGLGKVWCDNKRKGDSFINIFSDLKLFATNWIIFYLVFSQHFILCLRYHFKKVHIELLVRKVYKVSLSFALMILLFGNKWLKEQISYMKVLYRSISQ